MEASRIDWNNIDSVFVEDRLYEHFNAPKWVDLLSPALSVDDVTWFCTPDCNHPVTADDFLTSTPSPFSSKTRHRRSSSSHHQVPLLGDRNQRDSTFKIRAPGNSLSEFYEDVENKSPSVHASFSPNGSTTVTDPSAEKRKLADDDSLQADAIPRLKSTLSSSNLFAGRDLLKQISEFCTELKKLTTRTKEKEFARTRNKTNGICPFAKAKSSDIISSLEVGVEGKERSPLVEVTEQASGVLKRSKGVKDKKRTNIIMKDAENVPISIELDKNGHRGHLSQIRTSPPTPQCFSATRGPPPPESTPSPASKTRLKERQILGEVKQTRRDATTEENLNKVGGGVTEVVNGKTPDVFWFLKPSCTLSSSS